MATVDPTVAATVLAAAIAAGASGIKAVEAIVPRMKKQHITTNGPIATNGYVRRIDLEEHCKASHSVINQALVEHKAYIDTGNMRFDKMETKIDEIHGALVGDMKTGGLRARIELLELDQKRKEKK